MLRQTRNATINAESKLIDFSLYPLRFHFRATDTIRFPPGSAGNTLRGAFGLALRAVACLLPCESAALCEQRMTCPYARIFEPSSTGSAPSGLADRPRPFVLRALHLDGKTIEPGAPFFLDFHLFDVQRPPFACLVQAFDRLAQEGVGPRHGRAVLETVSLLNESGEADSALFLNGIVADGHSPQPLRLPLSSPVVTQQPVERLRIQFITPTELKNNQGIAARPEFSILAARIRDRVSTLCELYGAGALPIDFRAFGEAAQLIRLTECRLRHVDLSRRSTRTGQTHSLGGFVGHADYEGQLGPFKSYLYAAQWTGVGRQTVWGKGQILVQEL